MTLNLEAILTPSELENTLFYMGGGTDIQAILRFSHLTNLILSPTVSDYLDANEMTQIWTDKCDNLNQIYGQPVLELMEVVDCSSIAFENSNADHERNRSFRDFGSNPLLTDAEQRDYQAAFGWTGGRQMLKFVFKRTIGALEKEVVWIHWSAEALATLYDLVQTYQVMPRYVATIQTGVLEQNKPDNLLVRLFRHFDRWPEIWIRGFWASDLIQSYIGRWSFKRIEPFEPYGQVVQNYGKWYSSLGITTEENEDNPEILQSQYALSYVKAFARQPFRFQHPRLTVSHPNNDHRKVTIVYGSILDQWENYEKVIVTNHFAHTHPLPHSEQWETWENIYVNERAEREQTEPQKIPRNARLFYIYQAKEAVKDYARPSDHPHYDIYLSHVLNGTSEALFQAGLRLERYPTYLLIDVLKKAEAIQTTQGLHNLAFLPVGFEDELSAIPNFIQSSEADCDLTIYINTPMDFQYLAEGLKNTFDTMKEQQQ